MGHFYNSTNGIKIVNLLQILLYSVFKKSKNDLIRVFGLEKLKIWPCVQVTKKKIINKKNSKLRLYIQFIVSNLYNIHF